MTRAKSEETRSSKAERETAPPCRGQDEQRPHVRPCAHRHEWERLREREPAWGGAGGEEHAPRGHTYSLWLEGRLDLLPLQLIPVDVAEERVLLDVPLSFWATSQSLGRVLGHQLGERKRRKSHSQNGQLLPKMSTLRSPQGAVMPGWATCTTRPLPRDAPHQRPHPNGGSHLLSRLLVLKAKKKGRSGSSSRDREGWLWLTTAH